MDGTFYIARAAVTCCFMSSVQRTGRAPQATLACTRSPLQDFPASPIPRAIGLDLDKSNSYLCNCIVRRILPTY